MARVRGRIAVRSSSCLSRSHSPGEAAASPPWCLLLQVEHVGVGASAGLGSPLAGSLREPCYRGAVLSERVGYQGEKGEPKNCWQEVSW